MIFLREDKEEIVESAVAGTVKDILWIMLAIGCGCGLIRFMVWAFGGR